MQLPIRVLNPAPSRRILKCANPVVLWAAQHCQVFFYPTDLSPRIIGNPATEEM